MAWFQNTPALTPTSGTTVDTKQVTMTADRRAQVSRTVLPNGNISYTIKAEEYIPSKDKTTGTRINKIQSGYKSIADVENVLEHFAGTNVNYKVPLGSLQEITEST